MMISIAIAHLALGMASAAGAPPHSAPEAPIALPALSSSTAAEPAYLLEPALHQVETREPYTTWFDYEYVDVLFTMGDYRGVLLEGSFELQDRWLAVGKAGFLTRSRADLMTVSAGLGYVLPFQERFDLVGTGEIELGRIEVDRPGGGTASDNDVGARLRGGGRFQLTDEVELFGGLGVRTLFDNDLRIDGGALYAVSDRFSLMGRLEIDDDTQLSVGVRLGF